MPGVMKDQPNALADTTKLTDLVYFVQKAETLHFCTTLNLIMQKKWAGPLPKT